MLSAVSVIKRKALKFVYTLFGARVQRDHAHQKYPNSGESFSFRVSSVVNMELLICISENFWGNTVPFCLDLYVVYLILTD